MARKKSSTRPLEQSFDAASAPVYLIDGAGAIAYANPALAEWVAVPLEGLLGRRVEYHTEETAEAGLITGLCPTPTAMSGHRDSGAVSTLGRDGRLLRRRAEFLPVPLQESDADSTAHPVLVFCGDRDLAPNERVGDQETDAERLHAQIQQFRRSRPTPAIEPLLLGVSPAAGRLRRQFDAVVASGANALILGDAGSGRADIARAIFRHSATPDATLAPLDASLLDSDQLADRIATLRNAEGPITLLIEEAGKLPLASQAAVVEALAVAPNARVIATASDADPSLSAPLQAVVATVVLETTALSDRKQDLPLLTQWLIEERNAEGGMQISGLSPEAQHLMALYSWPGGIAQLRAAIAESHARASSSFVSVEDLPLIVKQASLAAGLPVREPTKIALDKFLIRIEKELLSRALQRAGGNKAETARLLGMTRPRLYRRLERFGILDEEPPKSDDPSPETDPQSEEEEP